MSRLSWSYLRFARRSQRRCFAGSSSGCDGIVACIFSAEIAERLPRVTFLLTFSTNCGRSARHSGRVAHPRAAPLRMLKIVCGIGLFAGVLAAANPACNLVPGWTPQGEARSFVADNLFEYMDGNAEGYLLYGFQTMHGVTCVKSGVTLVIDISDF